MAVWMYEFKGASVHPHAHVTIHGRKLQQRSCFPNQECVGLRTEKVVAGSWGIKRKPWQRTNQKESCLF